MKFRNILFIGLSALLYAVIGEDLYDSNSPVGKLTQINFAKRVTNNRKKAISIVHFYSQDDVHSAEYKDEFQAFTKDNLGMYSISAINCDTNPATCEKEGVTEYPTFRIYPPHPMPTVDLKQDSYSLKKLKKKASRFLENKVIEISSVNHDTFIKDNLGKAKVLLFTESKEIPVLYKALSYNFDKTLFFGIVRSTETSLAKKYKVKEYPTVILVKPGEKPRTYDGKMNYYGISNFINVYSEIFDFGDSTEKASESAASKPWMSSKLPELTKSSAKDICFGKKGLWVILLSNEAPSDGHIDTITTVREAFVSNLDDRGIQFSFMWIDTNLHPEWAQTFEIETFPQVVVLNAGKKKKFMPHTEELVTESSLTNLLNAITGGNGRFKRVPENNLPNLADRE